MEFDLKSERRIYEAGIRPSAEIGLALITRLEQAEQAVARVQAIREGDVCSGCLDVIEEALDGEPNE